MRSIVSVTTEASTPYRFTTVERMKRELGITDGVHDASLQEKIDEAGSDIEAFLNFRVARETVTETLRPEFGDGFHDRLILDRTPVAAIASVTVDDVALDASEYEVEPETGLLHRLDESGYPVAWSFCKSIVVVYSGGYILPGESGRTLPPAIEAGCVDLVTSFWRSRGRDPLMKAEDIPGVMSVQYWVGAVGQTGELPPGVVDKIARFRRAHA